MLVFMLLLLPLLQIKPFMKRMAFSCNLQLLEFVKSICPNLDKSISGARDIGITLGRSMSSPNDGQITWNYGEADHLKVPHHGIGGLT